MSKYQTTTAILNLLPMLPQTSTSSGYTATSSLVDLHLTRAASLIDAMIANRYDISQFTNTSAPPILQTICEDITGYYVLRSEFSQDNQNVSEWVEKFQEAMEFLTWIRDGKMDIPGVDESLIETTSTTLVVSSTTENFTPTFNEGNPLDWEVDPDKL